MKRLAAITLALCLLLTGCSWMDGNYHSVTPHRQLSGSNDSQVEIVENMRKPLIGAVILDS